MATSGPVTPVTVISVTSPQVQAPPPPTLPPTVTEPEQEEQPVRVVAVADAPYVQCQPPTMISPQPQAPLATAAPQQPGVYTPAQTMPISTQQAMTVPTPPTPAPTLFAQPAPAPVASPPMMQLQVLVPAPGLTPGQGLAFPAPMGAGQPPKQMVVKVQQGAAPGAVVTVQYPLPMPTHTLPNPNTAMLSEGQADHNGAVAGWLMFGAGWCCMCTFFPFGLLIWAVGAALYFCKPPHRRANLRQSRTPAYASLITLFACLVLGLMVLLGFAAIAIADDPDFNFKPMHRHPHPQQHHGGFLKWGGPMNHDDQHPPAMLEERSMLTGEQDVTMPRHKPCPFGRLKQRLQRGLKKIFMRASKRSVSGSDKSPPPPPLPPTMSSGPDFPMTAKEAKTIWT